MVEDSLRFVKIPVYLNVCWQFMIMPIKPWKDIEAEKSNNQRRYKKKGRVHQFVFYLHSLCSMNRSHNSRWVHFFGPTQDNKSQGKRQNVNWNWRHVFSLWSYHMKNIKQKNGLLNFRTRDDFFKVSFSNYRFVKVSKVALKDNAVMVNYYQIWTGTSYVWYLIIADRNTYLTQ